MTNKVRLLYRDTFIEMSEEEFTHHCGNNFQVSVETIPNMWRKQLRDQISKY